MSGTSLFCNKWTCTCYIVMEHEFGASGVCLERFCLTIRVNTSLLWSRDMSIMSLLDIQLGNNLHFLAFCVGIEYHYQFSCRSVCVNTVIVILFLLLVLLYFKCQLLHVVAWTTHSVLLPKPCTPFLGRERELDDFMKLVDIHSGNEERIVSHWSRKELSSCSGWPQCDRQWSHSQLRGHKPLLTRHSGRPGPPQHRVC